MDDQQDTIEEFEGVDEPRGSWMRWIVLVALLSLISIRATTVFAPDTIFDTDPMVNPEPMAALGPLGSMVLDAMLLLVCAATFVIEVRRGKGLDWRLIGLGLISAPVVVLHGATDAGDMWIGASWLAAVFAGVALAHLAREPRLRVVAAAVLLGLAGPLLARAIAQVAYEHPATVQIYEDNKEEILAQRGWSPDSPSARIFERRLRQPLPTTWYATSNVLSTIMLTVLVAALGLAIVGMRRGEQSGFWGALLLIVIGSGAMLWLGGSKGAMGIAAIGVAVVVIPLTVTRARSLCLRGSVVIVVALPLLVVGAIALRGVLPEGFAGDRSLLFRSHYWQSSAKIVTTNPLLGVGPDGYQDAYVLRRVERNPEEVTSAHNVVIDWIATLGVTGFAWCALLAVLLVRASRVSEHDPPEVEVLEPSPPPVDTIPHYAAGTVATLMFVAMLVVERGTLGGPEIFVRCIGALGMYLLSWMVMRVLGRGESSIAWWAFAAAAVALVMHAMMDITMTQPSTAAWCFGLLGVAGLALPGRKQGPQAMNGAWTTAAILALLATGLAVMGIVPGWRQHKSFQAVVHELYPPFPNVPDQIRQRQTAARMLEEAYEIWRINKRPLHAAIDQLLFVARDAGGDLVRRESLAQAQLLAQRAVADHDDTPSHGMLSLVSLQLAMLSDDTDQARLALEHARTMTERDPNGRSAWVRYGDAAWLNDDRGTAAEAYQRALNINDNYELDPLKQMPEREVQRLRERIERWQQVES